MRLDSRKAEQDVSFNGPSLLKKSLISSSSKKKPAFIAFEEAEPINKKVIRLSKGSKHITQQSKKEAEGASVGKGRRPQPRELQQLLKVVTCCDHQRFAVDAEDAPEAETPHAMPIFGFRKQRFHAHLALAQRFLISGSLLI